MKVLVFGTSRLHRPFVKRVGGEVISNIRPGIEVVFPKIGYFHTAIEILQAIKFLKRPDHVPKELRSCVFRIEPRATTPLNEFDNSLEHSIRNGIDYNSNLSLDKIDVLIIEVSSSAVNIHPTGYALHTNPNIDHNVIYADLGKGGYYEKYLPDMGVEKIQSQLEDLTSQLTGIKNEISNASVIVLGHLRSTRHPNSTRDRIHELLIKACSASGCTYFDTAEFLDEHGWAKAKNGDVDIHHLSHEGENAIGKSIQEFILQGCQQGI